jgi:hypothetical protein
MGALPRVEMEQAKTAQELGLGESKHGYKWEAGATPPGDSAPGRWAAIKRAQDWVVIFRSDKGAEYVIHAFPPSDTGERAAKLMALKLVEIAWGKHAEVLPARADQDEITNPEQNPPQIN